MLKALKAWNRRRVLQRRINKAAPDYARWIDHNERRHPPAEPGIKISIVMPVFRPDMAQFRAAVLSVRSQSYGNWELCIADDASVDPELSAELLRMVATDKRIKLHVRAQNGHISLASNDALGMVTGEWVCLLDQDDLLSTDALAWVAWHVKRDPEMAFWYSDRDKITEDGQRFEPFFKPDFDLEMCLGQNYICHLAAMRTTVLKEIGGFRAGYEGAQDHDLFLRYISRVGVARVGHIPHVLYHWRSHPGSTAQALGNKDYAANAGVRAVESYLAHVSPGAHASLDARTATVRVRYPLPEHPPLVSIIIPTKDRLDLLKPCIDSIWGKTTYRSFEIIVIDNGTTDPATLAYLHKIGREGTARVFVDAGPFNYSRLNNRAATHACGDLLLLMNNDVEVVEPDWLAEMVSLAVRPRVGCVGAKLLYPNGRIQHGGLVLGIGGVAAHVLRGKDAYDSAYFNWLNLTHEVSAVTGACLLVSKSIYMEVDGLNEDRLAVAFNDVDFCLKVRARGYTNLYAAHAVLVHHESVSRGVDSSEKSVERWRKESHYMQATWGKELERDPYYNANLSLKSDEFAFDKRSRV